MSSINPKVLPYLQLYLDKYGTFMLTSLVIVSRQPDRSAPCSRLPASSPVTISPVVHPVSVQQLTKCSSRKSFVLKTIHFDGVYPLLALPLTTTTPSSVYPISYSLSFHTFAHSFALFCIFLHASNMQLFSFQAIPHSLAKTPGVGYPLSLPGAK